jgi:hypothetical protein
VLVAGADELRHAPGADTARPNRWRRKAWPTLPSDRGTMPASAKAVASEPLFRPSQGYWLSSVAQQPTVQAETVPVGRPTAGADASAPESVLDPRGASPLQAYALRPVTEGNCVAVRRGGEQPEVNRRSVG